jgi:hypothetical protein
MELAGQRNAERDNRIEIALENDRMQRNEVCNQTKSALEKLTAVMKTLDGIECKDLATMQSIYRAQLTIVTKWCKLAIAGSKVGIDAEFPAMYDMDMTQIKELMKNRSE